MAREAWGRWGAEDEIGAPNLIGPEQICRAAGLVRSQEGAHGGCALAHAPAEIDLAQVWLAVNGEGPLMAVHSPNIDCPFGVRLEDTLYRIDRRAVALLLEELRAISVADVVAGVSPQI